MDVSLVEEIVLYQFSYLRSWIEKPYRTLFLHHMGRFYLDDVSLRNFVKRSVRRYRVSKSKTELKRIKFAFPLRHYSREYRLYTNYKLKFGK